MNTFIEPKAGNWILVAGPRSLCPTLLTLTARLAECGSVRVLDGGNQFNAYLVARAARGRPGILERITVSRAFTCYQMLALLESTPDTPAAFILLHLLSTFYDESVPGPERGRLLRQCIPHLHRLSRQAGGVVSVHPPAVPGPVAASMFEMLTAAASEVWQSSILPQPVKQPALL